MSESNLWNVRMRALDNSESPPKHLSAAERLVDDEFLNQTVSEMVTRAHVKSANDVRVTFELVPAGVCRHVRCLPVQTVHPRSPDHAAAVAAEVLIRAGVSPMAALTGLAALRNGLNSNRIPMSGASIWDKETGERLEPDQINGVRYSRFDYSSKGFGLIENTLIGAGLTYVRMREALAVANKTIGSGVTAELCWSGEAGYATGYVATAKYGYVRLTDFKPYGASGGRIAFIDRSKDTVENYIDRLQHEYILIEPPVIVNEPVSAEEFLDRS